MSAAGATGQARPVSPRLQRPLPDSDRFRCVARTGTGAAGGRDGDFVAAQTAHARARLISPPVCRATKTSPRPPGTAPPPSPARTRARRHTACARGYQLSPRPLPP